MPEQEAIRDQALEVARGWSPHNAPDYQLHGVFAVLGARTFDGELDQHRLLARAHPSGAWVEMARS